jgi:hypothetical protein
MSPESGIAIVTLLWGPTALWVAYRALRGRQRTNPIELFPSASAQEGNSQLVPAELGSLGEPDGPWVCRTCRSLNRREANRCYSCRMAKVSADRHTADELPVSPGVPVMAESIVRSSGEPAVATMALASPWNASAGPEVDLAHEQVILAGPPEASARVSVCPFLGLRDDSSTRYDYPEFANCCHSASERGSRSMAFAPRILAGIVSTRQPQRIGAEHQRSFCLTASHEQCARYLAVRMVTAAP